MARGIEGNEMASARKQATPAPNAQKKSNQKTLLGFFSKGPSLSTSRSSPPQAPTPVSLTPAPSSDPVDADTSSPARSVLAERVKSPATGRGQRKVGGGMSNKENGLPSPITPGSGGEVADDGAGVEGSGVRHSSEAVNSPSRKAKKQINYAESDDGEEDEEIFKQLSSNAANRRVAKKRKISLEDSDDDFGLDDATEAAMIEVDGELDTSHAAPHGNPATEIDPNNLLEDMDDFIVPDDSEDELPKSKKRKRASSREKSSAQAQSPPELKKIPTEDLEIPTVSTAQQWNYDPNDPNPPRSQIARPVPKTPTTEKKKKAHQTEPEERYPWLAKILDADRHPPSHPDYDPRTIYIPPLAWTKFSPFEKQYWEIKQKFWDTIVFFKKGKFYELYENDATIGNQLFDLKLTDRVNMRMVGVPEASLDQWANQFVAKGFKIARVDQMESALGKEMRERDGKDTKSKKEEKVIRRELATVLTAGTLVDGGMLQGDMSTFCVAIKEVDQDNLPAFGIAFVDTATAQFHLVDFVDDADMTKFETFVAQTRPAELLLEKSCLSAKALRILKNNTSQTTIWNYLKPTKEFWPADITAREIEATGYFVSSGKEKDEPDSETLWPKALREAKDKELVMSAFGALIQYLRVLKIDRELISLGNINWYDPMQKSSTLVLDGQSLINLEIFANSFDGGSDGTLFAMLNRCVTPFGKRMLRQWVCHPLANAARINARLDAVEALMADSSLTDKFTASLTKLPDLERLLSRVHAGRCKTQDFVKVVEGFEQIEYTMSIIDVSGGSGDGLIGQLLRSMPDLAELLKPWKHAFDMKTAKETGILVPEPGVEEEWDESTEAVSDCETALENLLRRARKELGSSSICFRDNGKEIYQLEVPARVSVPKSWDQMSATKQVKRYYTPELRTLVRNLQEARETHAIMAKQVAGRFYARFDEHYAEWLAAVKIVAHLDCLISLSKASASMGAPSCRPEFVDDDSEDSSRSVLSFTDLRHPTMSAAVADFIPNSIHLGGTEHPNLNLLTGANAAGKSTVLRMTCIAVILAQLGCHVPCADARLTPCDRIMSRLGANDNILQQQSTFFVELAETKKMLSEATPRTLVILDELGRGTSSVDGLAVAEAVLHHLATHVGCLGFFATHYHALGAAFAGTARRTGGGHPEVAAKRMRILVDDAARRVTFLYRLEDGVAEGSFGMHCASMCGIPSAVVEGAETAAESEFGGDHMRGAGGRRSGVSDKGDVKNVKEQERLALGWCSDVAWMLREGEGAAADGQEGEISERALAVLRKAIEAM